MAVATTAQAKSMLKTLGFDNADRAYSAAILGFQTGWNLGAPLVRDSKYGPRTDAALKTSYARARAGQSTMSAHFSFTEFRCKCGGKYANCRRIWEDYRHVRRLEAYRAKVGAVRIVSGCRCPSHNKASGGASSSQHLLGVAADVTPVRTFTQVRGYRLFAGLGYQNSTKRVVHVDSRDLGGRNLTGGTTTSPTVWVYY